MKIGVEIECFLNSNIYRHISNKKQSYHSRVPDKDSGWRMESDGSLSSQGNSFTIEFISPILSSVAELKSALGRLFYLRLGLTSGSPVVFTKRINRSNGWSRDEAKLEQIEEYERKGTGYIGLNESCGCHIHFSRKGKETPQIPVERCQQLAEDYLDWIRFAYPDAAPMYEKLYNRSYAAKIMDSKRALEERQSEFYYTQREGIEWRAFNLAGTTTVKEIIDRIVQAYTLIEKWSTKNYKKETITKIDNDAQYEDRTINLSSYFESMKHSYLLRWDGYGFSLTKDNSIQIKMNAKTKRIKLQLLTIKNTDTVYNLNTLDLADKFSEIEIFEEI